MAIREPDPNQKPCIDLSGEAGNAYALLGLASNLGKQLGFDEKKRNEIDTDMRSSDYEHLIQVFDAHFGDYVDLIRPPSFDDEAPAPTQPRKRTRSP